MEKGWIKISLEAWNTPKLQGIVKKVMRIEHRNLDPLTGSYIVVGESEYFTIKRHEGELLPQYDIIVTSHTKKWLWFRFIKYTFKVESIK
jgi:hypothetical protein